LRSRGGRKVGVATRELRLQRRDQIRGPGEVRRDRPDEGDPPRCRTRPRSPRWCVTEAMVCEIPEEGPMPGGAPTLDY
jgi:hypothetical protein